MTVTVIPRLLDTAATAAYLGISKRTLSHFWRAGRLPAPIHIGRRLLWDRQILDHFVDTMSGHNRPLIPDDSDW